MRFMMIVIPKEYATAKPDTMPDMKMVARMMVYNESLKHAGVLLDLNGLKPPSMGTRVAFHGGKAKVTSGPFGETKETVGGYWIIQTKSKEEAVEWASRAPMMDGDIIEVRQVQEISEFPEDIQAQAAKLERPVHHNLAVAMSSEGE